MNTPTPGFLKPLVSLASLAVALFLASCASESIPVQEQHKVTATPVWNSGLLRVKEVDTPPAPLGHMKAPVYPDAFRRSGQFGYAVFEYIVDEKGNVLDPQIKEASDIEFAKAAIAAAREWRFRPAVKNGKRVKVLVNQRMEFNMED